MKVLCPSCSTPVSAANMNLDTGWAKCDACHELFALAAVVPGFSIGVSPPTPERPLDAHAVLERTRDVLLIHRPAEGMRAATTGLLGFALVWLGFIAFWTCGALGIFGGGGGEAVDILFASCSIPFWIVGFGMLGLVAWQVYGTRSIRIGREGMQTHTRCLSWSRARTVELEHVQHARHYEPKVKGEGVPVHGMEIVYRNGSIALTADSEAEEKWLIAEVNDFLTELRG